MRTHNKILLAPKEKSALPQMRGILHQINIIKQYNLSK